MKNAILLGLLISFTICSVYSQQQQVPNGGFEDWETHVLGFEYPIGWDNTSSSAFILDLTPVIPSTDAVEGSFSVLLESKLVPIPGVIVIPGIVTLGSIVVDFITSEITLEGGIPFTDRPMALIGSYKNFPAVGDSAMIKSIFTKWDPAEGKRDTIGIGAMYSIDTVATWTNFSIPINFTIEDAPDTMNINISSSNILSPGIGSYMLIDNLSFDYPVGIHEQNALFQTKVFPNPATEKVSFCFEREIKAEIMIFNNNGQIVYTAKVNDKTHEADLSLLSPGTYYYSILDGYKKLSSGKILLK